MSGAHIEREARVAQTGLTELQRDRLIADLRRRGWSQARIGRRLGMTQQAVSLRLQATAGRPKVKVRRETCDGCFEDFAATVLVNGRCPDCLKIAPPASGPERW